MNIKAEKRRHKHVGEQSSYTLITKTKPTAQYVDRGHANAMVKVGGGGGGGLNPLLRFEPPAIV